MQWTVRAQDWAKEAHEEYIKHLSPAKKNKKGRKKVWCLTGLCCRWSKRKRERKGSHPPERREAGRTRVQNTYLVIVNTKDGGFPDSFFFYFFEGITVLPVSCRGESCQIDGVPWSSLRQRGVQVMMERPKKGYVHTKLRGVGGEPTTNATGSVLWGTVGYIDGVVQVMTRRSKKKLLCLNETCHLSVRWCICRS